VRCYNKLCSNRLSNGRCSENSHRLDEYMKNCELRKKYNKLKKHSVCAYDDKYIFVVTFKRFMEGML